MNPKLNPKQREALQEAILRVLDANHTRFGLNIAGITMWSALEGFPALTADQVELELEYLQEHGLVEIVTKTLEPANRAWKRTAKGRDYLSERGF